MMESTIANDLYSAAAPVGLLKGFSPVPNQLEVEVIVPYSDQSMPGFGEFLLAEIGPNEALVGRVVRFNAAGQLVSPNGDAYLADLARTSDMPPAAVMRQMLRYTMKMQLLGQLRFDPQARQCEFSVGERAFITLGCRVRQPSEAALAYLCNVGLESDASAAPLGRLAYGQRVLDAVPVKFSVDRLKGRRSFVFARAGYGKSNLMKYLISQLYSSPPDVGLLIFDPEGEYALPDTQGRPGLINVPQLRDRVSLYTNRNIPSRFAHIKKGEAHIDFGDILPQDIVTAFVPKEKQENVFANILRSLKLDRWRALAELLAAKQFEASDRDISEAGKIRIRRDRDKDGDVIVSAIRNNLIPPITRLHRTGATLSRNVIGELKAGRIVIVDTSLLGSEDAQAICGLVLHRIFNYNKRHFTEPTQSIVRCLAVIEEAQTVLSERQLDDRNVFVRWVKEGRKYGLGCVLVTQQPGAIAEQIISQGDNFFVMHLLNEGDLRTLGRHNGYYSDDILGFIRNEPIKGNCYFWSAPDQPFVLAARVADFISVTDMADRKETPAVLVEEPPRAPDKDAAKRLRQHIEEAIGRDLQVWLYRLESDGSDPHLVFSHDYLLNAVALRVQQAPERWPTDDLGNWCRETLPDLVKLEMKKAGARAGFATLSGTRRGVWVLPETAVHLNGAKKIHRQAVAVSKKL